MTLLRKELLRIAGHLFWESNSPYKGPIMGCFNVSMLIAGTSCSTKQTSCWWFEAPWQHDHNYVFISITYKYNIQPGGDNQYRRLIVTYGKVSKERDRVKCSYRFKIWRAHRQLYCVSRHQPNFRAIGKLQPISHFRDFARFICVYLLWRYALW